MEEKKKNIIKFEMSDGNKFVFYKLPVIVGQWISGIFFIFLVAYELISKFNFSLEGPFFISGILSGLSFMLWWKVRNARMASELVIDRGDGEFCAYIYNIKKEVKFRVDDVTEVNSSPEMFRFCLKDATWVSLVKDEMNKQFVEEIIKSFGISIRDKKLW